MNAHRIAVYITFCITIVFSILFVFLESYSSTFKLVPIGLTITNNFVLAIWGSNVIALIIEIINYQVSKKELMYKYIFETGHILENFKKIRFCLIEKRENYSALRSVYSEMTEINIYSYLMIINSFKFLDRRNKYYKRIDRISKPLIDFFYYVYNKRELLLFNENESILKEVIDKLNSKFEKTEVIEFGKVRLTDTIEKIENELLQLQDDFFNITPSEVKQKNC